MDNYDIRYDDKYGQLTHIDLAAEGAAQERGVRSGVITGLPRTRNVAREKRGPRSAHRRHLRLRGMKIKLADEQLLPDLLSFLRNEGCVAYYEGGGIEAVRPRSVGEQEATELRLATNRWRNEHPEAQIELSD